MVVGCGKKPEEADKGDDNGAAAGSAKAGDMAGKDDKKSAAPDFSKWDQAGKAKAWQGSWLAKENGRIQAWTVSGDSVQTFDGKEEGTFKLMMNSPCRAAFKNDKGMSYPRPFSSVGGKLRFGAGGYKSGAEGIFCDYSGATFVVDAAGKCIKWDKKFREWERADGDCGFKKNGEGAEVFFHGGSNAGEWMIDGDAIVPSGKFVAEAVEGDFAAAKTARDAKEAASK